MRQDWKVEAIRNPEQVYDKIKSLPTPTFVVIIGPDCALKDVVYDEFIKHVLVRESADHLTIGGTNTNTYISELTASFISNINDSIGVIKLRGKAACEHKRREEFYGFLREDGVKSIVGVYVKTIPFGRFGSEISPEQLVAINQSSMLSANPPTADGLEYLVTIRDD